MGQVKKPKIGDHVDAVYSDITIKTVLHKWLPGTGKTAVQLRLLNFLLSRESEVVDIKDLRFKSPGHWDRQNV